MASWNESGFTNASKPTRGLPKTESAPEDHQDDEICIRRNGEQKDCNRRAQSDEKASQEQSETHLGDDWQHKLPRLSNLD
eukprot:2597756-Rhodomonas_salina.1